MSRRTGAALVAAALALLAPSVAGTGQAAAGAGRAAAACVPAGAIGAHWRHLGGAASFLGPCLTGEVAVPRGRVQHFRGGSVY